MPAYPQPDSRKQEASALMQQGQLEPARALLEAFCQDNPPDAEALYLLGSANGMLGLYPEAIEALQASLAIQPNISQTLFALGGALKMAGQLEEAAEQFEALVDLNPRQADAHIALADTLSRLARRDEAKKHYQGAAKLKPDLAAAHIGLGTLAELQEDHEGALRHYRRAQKTDPNNPEYLCCVGSALVNLKRWQEARGLYYKALDQAADYPGALAGLARIYDATGDYQKAAKQIDILLKKKIYNVGAAMVFLQICRHLERCAEAVRYAEELISHSPGLPPEGQTNLHITIARALDHMGRYDEAFAHFKAGNEAKYIVYDPVGHKISIDNLIEAFSPMMLMALPRATIKTNRPIFIVGMPRSGTSLTEQILAAHPEVAGAGELHDMHDLKSSLPMELKSEKSWPWCIEELKEDDLNRLSRRYLDRLRTVSKKARYVTDKMPHNFYLLGLIQLLFPQAHIIHCRRDPLDTCLSIYFQNFLASHAYARNLFNLGTHYRQYQRLMEHWRNSLSIPMLDIDYEELVGNQEATVRRMLEFCGLEWDDNCMNFHKVKRIVDTASYDQVRQPLYTKSVQRWRHYEQHLADLKEGLERGY